MKVTAFNGSPRKNGNTEQAIGIVADILRADGIEVETIQVGNKTIAGCMACNWCVKHGGDRCVNSKDPVNEWIPKILESDGIILGSPVYFAGINGTMKSFIDRAGYVLGMHQNRMRYKVGASLVAVRRTGGIDALNQLNHFINYFQMLSPASHYWNVVHGLRPGEVMQDEEGVQTLQVLARNMSWLLKAVGDGKNNIPECEVNERKIMTNFIR